MSNVEKRGGLFGGVIIEETENVGTVSEPTQGSLFSELNKEPEQKTSEPEKVTQESKTDIQEVKSEKEAPESVSQDSLLTPEEKLSYYADRLISSVLGNKEITKFAIERLSSTVHPTVFRDENYIIYHLISKNLTRVKSLSSIDYEFIQYALDFNRDFLEKSTGYIDINAYGELEGSMTLGYIAGVLKHYNRLMTLQEVSETEFDSYLDKYMVVYKAIEANRILRNSSLILTDGLKVKGKKLVGFDDSVSYVKHSLADLEGLMDNNKGTGFSDWDEVFKGESAKARKPELIGDFGQLTALNDVYTGIYSGTFYQVVAPPKGGKSKFCARVCHNIAVEYGNNVSVWPFEGGKEAWLAQMRAIHFDYTYNEGVAGHEKRFGVDQDAILFDKFPDPSLKDLENVSALDLTTNGEYGNINFIDRPFNVETFIQDIDVSVKKNNSRAIIIDYLQLIKSEGRLSERECVAKAYPLLLDYCRKNNITVFTPAQYKQDVVEKLSSSDDTSNVEMRVSGGVSAEVIRTPDISIALWASTEDLRNNRMKILSLPSRFGKAFPQIDVYHDLGVCLFSSL